MKATFFKEYNLGDSVFVDGIEFIFEKSYIESDNGSLTESITLVRDLNDTIKTKINDILLAFDIGDICVGQASNQLYDLLFENIRGINEN